MLFATVYLRAGVSAQELQAAGFNAALSGALSENLSSTDPGGAINAGSVNVRYVELASCDVAEHSVLLVVDVPSTPALENGVNSRTVQVAETLAPKIPQGLRLGVRINLTYGASYTLDGVHKQ